MIETTHTIIVTRDETKIGHFFVEIWPKNTELKMIEGEWVSEDNVKKTTTSSMSLFEEIFGYKPDAGSKETKTIDSTKLDLLKKS